MNRSNRARQPFAQRRGQGARAIATALQQVEGHALRGLRTDTGQRAQRVDQPGQRCGVLHRVC